MSGHSANVHHRTRHTTLKRVWWIGWSLLVALGISLGLWQWQRAEDKREYLDELAAAPRLEAPAETPPAGSEIILEGEFLGEHSLFLDNRIVDGRVGVAVLTPFRSGDGRLWLIQRGFVATDAPRENPEVSTPDGTVEITGQWQPARDQGLLLGDNREGQRLQQIDLIAWEGLGNFAHEGWVHQQQGPGQLTSWWEPSVMPPSRHFGYAAQWWGLSLAALIAMYVGGRYLGLGKQASS
ncbi:SURF1 family protein [Aidingimonas halophila]|uniref:SURF1-like protein n=1 Tax=Aidingimonas halophila TaxID=574349 RepID=A0A1H3BY67_9GAMM|nr:SURF1 family protein [Aidingimonas halophila]GHC27324.1 SURF1-like protein [Aidingimonas halophila]SDX46860.1 Cytochrome oxidase assembly protein ShyY1 [Aidingimonas halophila]